MKPTEIIEALRHCAENETCSWGCPYFRPMRGGNCPQHLKLEAATLIESLVSQPEPDNRICSDCKYADNFSTEEPCCRCDDKYSEFVRGEC